MRTLEAMRNAVSENLLAEKVDNPNPGRLTQMVNAGKNHVVALRDRYDRHWSLQRKSYEVAQGDPSITLPDGSGADQPFRRLVAVKLVASFGGMVPVYAYGDPQEKEYGEVGFYLTREGRMLYFSPETGAPRAMTLLVHYAGLIPDLSADDAEESFAELEHDWCDLVEAYATMIGIPGGKKEAFAKWQSLYTALLDNLSVLASITLSAPRQLGRDPDRPY